LQTLTCGVALVALASLCFSYGKLIKSVETAAGSAGVIDTAA